MQLQKLLKEEKKDWCTFSVNVCKVPRKEDSFYIKITV